MTTPQQTTVLDADTVERLSRGFARCFETREARDDVFAPDVFLDIRPPLWRFQVQGAAALTAQLRAAPGTSTSRVVRVVPTAGGFVMEHEESAHDQAARKLWLIEVRDGRITEAVGYCNGGWDDDLRARHAAEAPMLRP
jgi:ketosteroid isomerase-like protein